MQPLNDNDLGAGLENDDTFRKTGGLSDIWFRQ